MISFEGKWKTRWWLLKSLFLPERYKVLVKTPNQLGWHVPNNEEQLLPYVNAMCWAGRLRRYYPELQYIVVKVLGK